MSKKEKYISQGFLAFGSGPKTQTQDSSTENSRIFGSKTLEFGNFGTILGQKSKFPLRIEVFFEKIYTHLFKTQVQNLPKTQDFGKLTFLRCRKKAKKAWYIYNSFTIVKRFVSRWIEWRLLPVPMHPDRVSRWYAGRARRDLWVRGGDSPIWHRGRSCKKSKRHPIRTRR